MYGGSTPTAKRAFICMPQPTTPTDGFNTRRDSGVAPQRRSDIISAKCQAPSKDESSSGTSVGARGPSCNPRTAARHRGFVDNPRAQRAPSGVRTQRECRPYHHNVCGIPPHKVKRVCLIVCRCQLATRLSSIKTTWIIY